MAFETTDLYLVSDLTTSNMALEIGNSTTESTFSVGQTKDIRLWYPWTLVAVFIVLPVGLTLNLVMAAAYIKSSLLTRGKPVHQLIFNMTMSDIMSCLVSQPFVLFQYTESGSRYIARRKMTCVTSLVGLVIGFDSTVTALFLISCERLFAIASPLEHMHRVTRRTCRVAILITWTLVAAKNGVMFFWNRWSPYVPCVGITVMTEEYMLYVYNVSLYTCMGLIVLLNIILAVVVAIVKRKAGTMAASQTFTRSLRRKVKSTQSELKIVKIVFLTVSVLFVTWIPNNTFANIVLTYINKRQPPPYDILVAYHMTRAVVLLCTVADPLIYFLQNSQCHAAVYRLFGRTQSKTGRQQSIYSLNSHSLESNGSSFTVKSVGTEC